MADLATVKYQNFGSGTQRVGCASATVEIFENPDPSTFQHMEEDHQENHEDRQLLKNGRKKRCGNPPVSWCFVLVFLWAVLATIFCLVMFVHEGEKDEVSPAALKEVKSITIELKNENGDLLKTLPLTFDLKQLNSTVEYLSPATKTEPIGIHGQLEQKLMAKFENVQKQIYGVKDQIKTGFDKLLLQIQVQLPVVNSSSSAFSTAPPAVIQKIPIPTTTPPALSTPPFFFDEQYTGA